MIIRRRLASFAPLLRFRVAHFVAILHLVERFVGIKLLVYQRLALPNVRFGKFSINKTLQCLIILFDVLVNLQCEYQAF